MLLSQCPQLFYFRTFGKPKKKTWKTMGKVGMIPHWTRTPLKNAQDFHYLSKLFPGGKACHFKKWTSTFIFFCSSKNDTFKDTLGVFSPKGKVMNGSSSLVPPGKKKHMLQPREAKPAFSNIPLEVTPRKTNMEPENEPLEEEIPIRNHHFQVPC